MMAFTNVYFLRCKLQKTRDKQKDSIIDIAKQIQNMKSILHPHLKPTSLEPVYCHNIRLQIPPETFETLNFVAYWFNDVTARPLSNVNSYHFTTNAPISRISTYDLTQFELCWERCKGYYWVGGLCYM